MTIKIPTQLEKCKGAMLATAIGDALGWPNEPRSKNREKKTQVKDSFVEWIRSSNKPRWHDEKILPGEYSDDTQLTLAVARSIIMDNWEKYFEEKELPFWLQYERGGGRALLKAAKSYEKKVVLWQSQNTKDYFQAGGNGAVMRILPHVIMYAKENNIRKLMIDIIKDTLITHGHPRAILGATCYAYALDYLLRKENILTYGELAKAVVDAQNIWGGVPDEKIFKDWFNVALQNTEYDFLIEWNNTLISMAKQLEFIDMSLRKGLISNDAEVLSKLGCFGKTNGAGDVTILAAIYLASKYANNPSVGLKVPAFSFGADTDTIASITGGLLGMLCGIDWIPLEWKKVQDYNCLVQMTELLMVDNKIEAVKNKVAYAKKQNNDWQASPIGNMRLIDKISVPNGKNGIVIIEKWQTALGQTFYQKSFQLNNLSMQVHKSKKDGLKIDSEKSRQFSLSLSAISELLEKPDLKTNITIEKVLRIMLDLLKGKETTQNISIKYDVDLIFVEQVAKYIT